jgi:hypothetical protein
MRLWLVHQLTELSGMCKAEPSFAQSVIRRCHHGLLSGCLAVVVSMFTASGNGGTTARNLRVQSARMIALQRLKTLVTGSTIRVTQHSTQESLSLEMSWSTQTMELLIYQVN